MGAHPRGILMNTLIVELTAAFVDNPATPLHKTEVEIILIHSKGYLNIQNIKGVPRSVHRFVVKDAATFGYGAPYHLTKEQTGLILAMACSLANPRILFSPIQPNQPPISLKLQKIPTKVEVIDTLDEKSVTVIETIYIEEKWSSLLKAKLNLDEFQILNVASRLLKFKVFDTTNRSLLELNVVEAIKRYREALMSVEGLACYNSLYMAFEKAVNADKDRKNTDFDVFAYTLTGLPQTEVRKLRTFNNRVKHTLRNKKDFNLLKTGEAQLGPLARNLKKAADNAILARI